MAVLLGLFVALTYGAGDFFGGLASKRAAATKVVVGAFALAFALLVAVTGAWAALGDLPRPHRTDLLIGLATGVAGPIGVGCLYRGLSLGRMSVVAPITAVVAAIVPFGWGLARGERPGTVAVAGAVLAMVAVVLISAAPAHPDDTAPVHVPAHPLTGIVPTALASGAAFGVVFVLLGSASHDAGLWPLVAARGTSVVGGLALLAALGARSPSPESSESTRSARSARWAGVGRALTLPRAALATTAAAGVLDVTANAAYLAATRTGLLSVVAVVSSLYPAATVVLARVVLGERLHRIQLAGLALATVGVVAIAA
jgi:uncharacterized membrane protein